MIVRQAPDEHRAWLEERVGIPLIGELRAIESVDESGQILAMVGFDDWGVNAVKVHFAADNARALPAVAQAAARYVFDHVGRKYVIAWTPVNNRKAMRWKEWAGFREVYRLTDGWSDGVDMVFSVLSRDDCKFLAKE